MQTKSFREIMDELGFNENASFESKKAFLKHLFKTATTQEKLKEDKKKLKQFKAGEQLNLFDFKNNKIS